MKIASFPLPPSRSYSDLMAVACGKRHTTPVSTGVAQNLLLTADAKAQGLTAATIDDDGTKIPLDILVTNP